MISFKLKFKGNFVSPLRAEKLYQGLNTCCTLKNINLVQPFKALHTVAGVAVLSGFVLQNLSPGMSGQWGAPGCHFLPGPSGSMGCLGSLIR